MKKFFTFLVVVVLLSFFFSIKAFDSRNLPEEQTPDLIQKTPQFSPKQIKEIQGRRLIKLGFHSAIGMNEKEFLKDIPLPEDEPNPILVMRLQITTQTVLLKTVNYIEFKDVEDIFEETPEQNLFYWIYNVKDGTEMKGISPENCAQIFQAENRRGLTLLEGIALIIQQPPLAGQIIDCPGSRSGWDSTDVPCIYFNNKQPFLSGNYLKAPCSESGSASCACLSSYTCGS